MSHSKRASRVWQRMEQMFGAALNAAYPLGMTDAMAQVVDRLEDQSVKDGLARMKGMRRPPTLMEFQRVMDSTPAVQVRPNPMMALVAYATKNLSLTDRQLRSPWTFLYEGDARAGSMSFVICGVRIPADLAEGRDEITVPVEALT